MLKRKTLCGDRGLGAAGLGLRLFDNDDGVGGLIHQTRKYAELTGSGQDHPPVTHTVQGM
jgi:hypothetical protein